MQQETLPVQNSRLRELRLGIDYGTSQSKLVITDYSALEGDRSFIVRPEGAADNEYRIPSTVCASDVSLWFGFSAEERAGHGALYRSLKMLCAYPDRFYGDFAPLPDKLTARDLATLYVGHLIALGQEAGRRYAKRYGANPSMSVTLGVPMAQLDDKRLFTMFVDIAREAFSLGDYLDLLKPVSIADAGAALISVRTSLAETPPASPRDWVRSEAEAALFWAHRSPDVADGRYACVDVGAGTTSASWFHIVTQRSGGLLVNNRLSFYGAACAPPACDALGRIFIKCLSGCNTLSDVRGQEDKLRKLLDTQGRVELDRILEGIAGVLSEASAIAFEKEKSTSRWHKIGRMFFLGGGTKLDLVRSKLLEVKSEWLKSDSIAEHGLPADLTEENGGKLRDDPAFMLVAYGLARRLGDVPDVFTPSQIEPIYSKTSDSRTHIFR